MPQSTAQLSLPQQESGLVARLTTDPHEIRQALELRYRVFAEDMGATVEGADRKSVV